MPETILQTAPRLQEPDLFYKSLAQLHAGLTPEESLLVNSKLLLVLANHIGDHQVLLQAIDLVKSNVSAD